MATTEVQLVRLELIDLPKKLREDLFETWNGRRITEWRTLEFSDFIKEYFDKEYIKIRYYDVDTATYYRDEIELNERDLTWLQMKYT